MKSFKSECEKLRYRALRDGSGSSADMSWRNHAKSCPECQASLHILELLNSHDDSGTYRLSPKQADKLVEKARERYGVGKPKTFMERLVGYAGKAAAVAILLFGVSQLATRYSVMGWMIDKSVNAVTDTVLSVAVPEAHAEVENFAMSEGFVTPASMAIYGSETTTSVKDSSSAVAEPHDMMQDISPFDSLDNAIGLLSKKIDAQIEDIGNLIDADFNVY